MLQLPALPEHILNLRDSDYHRVRAEFPSAPKGPGNCITCRGQGSFFFYAPDTDDEVVEIECDCREQFKLHMHLLNAGIPLNYQRMRWNDARHIEKDALAEVISYREMMTLNLQTGMGLVGHGEVGTGKSLVGYLLSKDLLARGYDVFALTMNDFLDRYASGWGAGSVAAANKAWFEERIRSAGVLLIDDMAREYSGRSAVAESALDHTLRSRVAGQLITLITSNKTPNELAQVYSVNALSLLTECSTMVRFGGSDWRPNAAGRRKEEARQGIVRPVML